MCHAARMRKKHPAGQIEKFSLKPVGHKAGLQIFSDPGRSFAP